MVNTDVNTNLPDVSKDEFLSLLEDHFNSMTPEQKQEFDRKIRERREGGH